MKALGLGIAAASALLAASITPALAAGCHKEPNFAAWLDGVRKEAASLGVSQGAINAALGDVRFDPAIVKKDHAQGVFTQDFLQFSDRMVSSHRLTVGPTKIAQYKRTFDAIEKQFGVPAPVLTAFWALETDFGAFNGDGPTLTSLATLAYDCRRPDLFRTQLIAAIRIIDRGDLRRARCAGPGRANSASCSSFPTAISILASISTTMAAWTSCTVRPTRWPRRRTISESIGWRRGEPWLQEVRVPGSLPWDQADLAIKLPLSKWAAWGVRLANGKPLSTKGPDASLLLPMGRNGPAFLAYPNFDVYLVWNNSLVYSTTAAYLATRLAGAPKVQRGSAVSLSAAKVRQVQKLLADRGYDVGKIDGVIGALTRAAVKAMQIKFGLPADSYPDEALLARLANG